MATIWGFDAATLTAFDAAYWAYQPTAVQALKNANKGLDASQTVQSVVLAQQLMSQGYVIDVPIMVWGWDPYATMYIREFVDGFTWVPSGGQSAGGGTGVPPPGAIKVSTNLADYPPFAPPVVPPPPATSPIGGDLGFKINGCEVFSCSALDPLPVGFPYTDPSTGKVYVKTQLGGSLMGIGQAYCVWLETK